MNASGHAATALIILLLTTAAQAVSVGTAPGILDLGEVVPGKDYAFAFYLTTNSKNDLLVGLNYIKPHADIYYRNQTGRYTFIPEEASQEDISTWIEIPRDTLVLSQTNVKVMPVSGGGVVKSYGTANIILHVPDNAEPGYHPGAISLSPQAPSGATGGATGVQTFGVTRFIFVFRVAGTAARKGQVMTIFGNRLEEKKARLNVLFKNTGTCSMEAWINTLRLYDKYGNLSAELTGMNKPVVKPNDIVTLQAYWTGDNVKEGTYRAEVNVTYLTGYATLDDKVDIPAIVTVEKKPLIPQVEVYNFPWLTILLIIIIILLVIYYIQE